MNERKSLKQWNLYIMFHMLDLFNLLCFLWLWPCKRDKIKVNLMNKKCKYWSLSYTLPHIEKLVSFSLTKPPSFLPPPSSLPPSSLPPSPLPPPPSPPPPPPPPPFPPLPPPLPPPSSLLPPSSLPPSSLLPPSFPARSLCHELKKLRVPSL